MPDPQSGTIVPSLDPKPAQDALVADDGKPGSVEQQARQVQEKSEKQEQQKKQEQQEGLKPEKTWYGFKVLDAAGKPVKNEKIRVELPDGSVKTLKTNGNGIAKLENTERGGVKASFPDRYGCEWSVLRLDDQP